MTNWLEAQQNTSENLRWIAASSDRYRRAKALLRVQAVFAVVVPVILSVARLIDARLASWAAFYGVFATLFDLLLLDRRLKQYLKQGALAQEVFDTDVLRMEWNDDRVGARPTAADAAEWSSDYVARIPDRSHHVNWYPLPAGTIPIVYGRLICLLSNCRWDIRLRNRYSAALFGTALCLACSVIVVTVVADMRVETLLLALAAVLPALVWPLRGWKTQGEILESVESQRTRIERLWERSLDADFDQSRLGAGARAIQDDVFQRRKSSQPVFDGVYKFFRKADETKMNTIAEAMVAEYVRSQSFKQQSTGQPHSHSSPGGDQIHNPNLNRP